MPDKANNEQELTFWGHLDVLRTSLFHIVIALVICMAGGFIALQYIFDSFVLGPTHGDFFLYRWLSSVGKVVPFAPDFSADGFHVDIININVASQFMVHMTTAFWLALLLAFPYVLYELWAFIRPALYPKEKKNVGTAFFFGAGMFYLGCAVGYTVVFPFPGLSCGSTANTPSWCCSSWRRSSPRRAIRLPLRSSLSRSSCCTSWPSSWSGPVRRNPERIPNRRWKTDFRSGQAFFS